MHRRRGMGASAAWPPLAPCCGAWAPQGAFGWQRQRGCNVANQPQTGSEGKSCRGKHSSGCAHQRGPTPPARPQCWCPPPLQEPSDPPLAFPRSPQCPSSLWAPMPAPCHVARRGCDLLPTPGQGWLSEPQDPRVQGHECPRARWHQLGVPRGPHHPSHSVLSRSQ